MINLLNGNAYELIKTIPDNSIDLVCTDIPYELTQHGGGDSKLSERTIRMRDSVDFISNGIDYDRAFTEFIRICKIPNMIIFCSNLQIGKIISFFNSKGLKTDVLVWEKSNPAPMCNGKYMSDLEYIIRVYDKGCPFNNNVSIKYKRKCKIYPIMTSKDKFHPTQKPLKLMEELIEIHSFEDQIVLDPFMGSGTTGVACRLHNRNFIGFELDKHFFEIAENRINGTKIKKEDKYVQGELF